MNLFEFFCSGFLKLLEKLTLKRLGVKKIHSRKLGLRLCAYGRHAYKMPTRLQSLQFHFNNSQYVLRYFLFYCVCHILEELSTIQCKTLLTFQIISIFFSIISFVLFAEYSMYIILRVKIYTISVKLQRNCQLIPTYLLLIYYYLLTSYFLHNAFKQFYPKPFIFDSALLNPL